MSNRSLIALLLVGAVAAASNPDERSFQKFIQTEMKRTGSGWIDRNIVARVSAVVHERRNFIFFSLYSLEEIDSYFVGIFGTFVKVPQQLLDMISGRQAD